MTALLSYKHRNIKGTDYGLSGENMIKIDLITGFLGSGKTTFIKKYASYLLKKGMNIGILENDFGAVNVDMMLLKELEGENCELEMIAGGCDRETHRRRFKTKLIAMGMCGYDRVIVEPSGIFDVDEFFDALYEEPLDRWYEIGNVITIVDAGLEGTLSAHGEYLLGSEAASAGCVVFSRAGEASAEKIRETTAHLNQAMEAIQCGRRFGEDIFCKDWESLSDKDYEMLLNCGYRTGAYEKQHFAGQAFQSLYFMNTGICAENLKEAAERIMSDTDCGSVFRIKGFAGNTEGSWMELNAVREKADLCPIDAGQEVIIVIGENLVKEKIESQLNFLPDN